MAPRQTSKIAAQMKRAAERRLEMAGVAAPALLSMFVLVIAAIQRRPIASEVGKLAAAICRKRLLIKRFTAP
jgi:hypothetical protein